MGASFMCLTMDGHVTRTGVKKMFEEAQEDDRYENGHTYSGGFGMCEGLFFPGKNFRSHEEARNWLQQNCIKWESAQAVTVNTNGVVEWVVAAWCAS